MGRGGVAWIAMPINPHLALACALFLSQALAQGPAHPPATRPNVVFILADDLGWGDVGAFGGARIPTPNLDRVAAEGMRLTAHYAGSPVCAPSRCVLLTGQHTGHAVVRNNWENGGWGRLDPEGQYPLPVGTQNLALALQGAGYDTCAIGKWGLGGPVTSGAPNQQGFDHFFGYLCQRRAHNYFPQHLWRNTERVALEGNDWFPAHQSVTDALATEDAYWDRFAGESYAPDKLLDEALEWLDERNEQPFFLYYPSPIPHVALQVHAGDLNDFPREWDEGAYLGKKGYLPHPRPRAAYAAMVAHLDREVGVILDKLDDLGIAENTLVVFTSDNGPTYNGGTDSEFFASAGPFRGLKGSVYEGGLRVPTLVRWPQRIAAGTSSSHVSGFQDWYPTLADICNLERPRDTDGLSLVPTLMGVGEQPAHRLLHWELGAQAATRMGRWKLIYTGLQSQRPRGELYDLEADPGETTDRFAQEPEVAARLLAAMRDCRSPSAVFPQPWLDR